MSDYKVRLAAPAARMYEQISALAAGGKGSQVNAALLSLLDKVIDEVLPSNPTMAGSKFFGALELEGVYWISEGTIHFFYEINAKATTVVILSILNSPIRRDHSQRADIICTEMLMSGSLPTSQLKLAARRAVAN